MTPATTPAPAYRLSPDRPPEHAPTLMSGRPYPDCSEPAVLLPCSHDAGPNVVVNAFRVSFRLEGDRVVAAPEERRLRIGPRDPHDYRSWNRDWACAVGDGWRATWAEALALAIEEEGEQAARARRREAAARLALEEHAAAAPPEAPVAPAPKRARKSRRSAPKLAASSAPTHEEPAPRWGPPTAPAGEPFLPFDQVDGLVKYVRFRDGMLVLIDPRSCASHLDAARKARGLPPGLSAPSGPHAVLSAGRCEVDRAARTVTIGTRDRDSHSLGAKSLPGDQDERAIELVLFGPKNLEREAGRGV